MASRIKQNKNPIIYAMKKIEDSSNKDLIGTQSLRRFQLGPNPLEPSSISSSKERSIYLALLSLLSLLEQNTVDVAQDGLLGIVQQVTCMRFPNPISYESLSHCFFQPSPSVLSLEDKVKMENEGTLEMTTTRRSDAVEAWEVFDIIRNIQDPEHPLTLEQLNVVNLEHIIIVDCDNDNKDCNEMKMDNNEEIRQPFPHVDIRFT